MKGRAGENALGGGGAEGDYAFRRPRIHRSPLALLAGALRAWPFLLWVAVVAIAVVLHNQTERYGTLPGKLDEVIQQVAPVETARLLSMEVVPGQKLRVGDVVARMDTSLVDAQIAAEEARAAETGERLAGSQENTMRLLRQQEADAAQAEAELAAERQRRAQSEAELLALREELARREDLLRRRLIREEDVGDLRPQVAATEKLVETFPALIAALERRADEARQAADRLKIWINVEAEESLLTAAAQRRAEWRELVEQSRNARARQREEYVLRAAIDGEVSRILHTAGNVVVAGDPVALVVNLQSDIVLGYLVEGSRQIPLPGQRARVWRQGGYREAVVGVVETVSPQTEIFPMRATPIRDSVVRGRRMTIRLPADHTFLPGESLEIEIDQPGWMDEVGPWFARLLPARKEPDAGAGP